VSNEVFAVGATVPRDVSARSGQRTLAGEPLRRLLLVAAGLLAFAVTLVLIAIVRGQQLSPVDEPAHADYAWRISHGSIPSKGSPISPEIRHEWACHGLGDSQSPSPQCVGSPTDFATDSQDYAFGDPPLYYTVTGWSARVLDAVTSGHGQFITLGRSVGAAWLFSAMLVLYLALRVFRVPWRIACASAVLLPLCPGILASTSTISSDGAAALSGVAALYVLARITVQGDMGWVLPTAVAALATSTKILNGLPILAVAGVAAFLAVAALRRGNRGTALRASAISGGILIAFGAVYLGWSWFQAGRGEIGWVNPNRANSLPLTGSGVGDLLSNLFGTYQRLTTNYWLAPQINGEILTIWATFLGVVLAAAPLLAMAVSRTRSWGWALGVAAFTGVSAVSLFVEAEVYRENNEYFVDVAARYALSFLPWMIACLAIVAARRRLLKTSVVFAGVGTAVLLMVETGLFTLGPALVDHTPFLIG
jgi:hypothetical protein